MREMDRDVFETLPEGAEEDIAESYVHWLDREVSEYKKLFASDKKMQHARAHGDYAANLEDTPHIDVGQVFRSVLSIVGRKWEAFFDRMASKTTASVVRFTVRLVFLVVCYQFFFF